jgi:hypothetical protein
MNSRPIQFGVRENTASLRRHASRLTVDSLPAMSEARPSGLQYREPTPALASHASGPDESITTMPLDAATGGERSDRAETFSAPGTVIIAKESRLVPLPPEPFVSADEAAQFLVSNVAICWSSHVEALQAPMRSEQGASAKSGCFDCRCSPPLSYGMKPRFQNH